MLSGVWLVVAVLATIVLTWWVTFTVTRIGRLYTRTEAAQASMDAQLVRRAAALAIISETAVAALGAPESLRLRGISQRALVASAHERQAAENDVSRAIAGLVEPGADPGPIAGPEGAELAEASARAAIARRFYNDAARDTRSLLSARMPRYLRLARGRELPQFFDIEDAPRWTPAPAPAPAEDTDSTRRAPDPDPNPALLEATDRA